MKRSQDDFRAMMDLVEIKLKDQDSTYELVKLSLVNSALFQFKKLQSVFSNSDQAEHVANLQKCADESLHERRRKLDHELYLLLRDRFHLAPGDLRARLDRCWSGCLSGSFAKHTNHKIEAVDILVANPVYDHQLMSIVSEAWQDYLDKARGIIKQIWVEANNA